MCTQAEILGCPGLDEEGNDLSHGTLLFFGSVKPAN